MTVQQATASYLPSSSQNEVNKQRMPKIPLVIRKEEWRSSLLFLLSMALVGLKFYPALLFVIAFLLHTWRHDRYGFIIMSTIFAGGYAFYGANTFPIKIYDLVFIVSIILLFTFKKAPIVRKALTILVIYAASLFIIALFSRESISTQFLTMRGYMMFSLFIIPIVAFSGEEFSLVEFGRRWMPYALLVSIFYIVDAFVLCGSLFVPTTFDWDMIESTFYSPNIHPFAFHPYRKYPHGLYLIIPAIYPVARFFRLRPWQWIVFVLALMSTQTFTFITAIVVTYIIFIGGFKKLMKYMSFLILALIGIYLLDSVLPYDKESARGSYLRIKSSIDQIIELTEYVDDEDIAKFGSGRLAQAIPKFELVNREGRQLTGLGFLHPEKTKIQSYIITNEYYTDIANNDEVATGIEVIPMQIYITVGILGLIAHILFLFALYWIIRRLRFYGNYLATLCACSIAGLGGFTPLTNIYGLALLALSFSVVILDNRNRLKGFQI